MATNSLTDCVEDEGKLADAVNAVKKWCEKHISKSDSDKKPLFEREEYNTVFLDIAMKKMPASNAMKRLRIPLPFPCSANSEDTCLFVGDLNKRKPDDEATIHHYRILLQNHDISVSEIITVHQLKSEYMTFESKRRLVCSYSIFLCEGRITKMMTSLLGKTFIRRRKLPITVDFRATNLKEKMNEAIATTTVTISGRGTSCICEIGHLKQPVNEIVSNTIVAVKTIDQKLPGGGANVASLYIKSSKSLAVPIFISLESAHNLKLPSTDEKACDAKPVIDELTTEDNRNVMVYPSGEVIYYDPHLPELEGEEEENMERKVLKNVQSLMEENSVSTLVQSKKKPNDTLKKAIKKRLRKIKKEDEEEVERKAPKKARLLTENNSAPSLAKREKQANHTSKKALPEKLKKIHNGKIMKKKKTLGLKSKSKKMYKIEQFAKDKSPSAKLLSVKKRKIE